jgi:hypothetical protein
MFKDWKTTVLALIPLLAYGLKLAGVWPDSIPLPPLDQIWPALLAVVGVGVAAKDAGN